MTVMSYAANKYIAAFVALALALSLLAPGLVNAASFTDIDDVDPAIQADIQMLVDAGILTGYNDGTEFHPYDQVKRAQVAKIIVETMGWAPNAGASTFSDVTIPEDKGYIGALVEHGVATGYTDGTFGPYDNVTRQQLASFFMRALGLEDAAEAAYTEGTIGLDFFDADDIDEAHKANVALANEIGFLQGYPDGTFGPRLTAARTALAKFGANLYDETRRQGFLDAAEELGAEVVTGVALTDGPDLVSVSADGDTVTYKFDEEVDEVDEDKLFLYTFDGSKFSNGEYGEVIESGDADTNRSDETEVIVEFVHEKYVNLATIAGVEEGAVEDADGDTNVEASLPLNDVTVDNGESTAPTLVDIDIDSFETEENEDGKIELGDTVEVEFIFDQDLDDGAEDGVSAENFILYFDEEGQGQLRGTDKVEISDDTVTVTVEVYNNSVTEEGLDEDDISRAVVIPDTVKADDGGEPNPLTVYEVSSDGDVDGAADLEDVEINLGDEELIFTFDEDVEDIDGFGEEFVLDNFGVVTVTGDVYTLGSMDGSDVTDIDGDEVTIEFDDGDEYFNGAVAGVVLEEIDNSNNNEMSLTYGEEGIDRSYNSGEMLGPILESAEVDEADDEEVTVLFYFNKDIEDTTYDEGDFILYTADGDDYTADDVEVDDDLVEATFEIDEDDFEDVVLAAIGFEAVQSDEDKAYSPEGSVELEK